VSAAGASAGVAPAIARPHVGALRAWWPLIALTALAAALRFATLDLQSLWYDEAFTPVRVLHPSLWATLRSIVHTENTPPLWYVIAWADTRVLGTGALALRWPSALAGTLTVPVVSAIGHALTARRSTAIAAAALVAVNPLLVWYSQEARAYELFVLAIAISMLCFLRALARPSASRMAAFAVSGSLALLSHYFAVFLLAPMALMLVLGRPTLGECTTPREPVHGGGRGGGSGAHARSRAAAAVGALALVGLALLPLISAQGGHGTQWIGRWALSSRLATIPQYYLTGYSGAALGHGIELLVALLIVAGLGIGLWRVLDEREERAAAVALAIAAGGVLTPVVLALFGADYLAPRNLVAAMIPVSALIAVVVVSRRAARAGVVMTALIVVAFGALSLDVDLSPRLQRGDWRGLSAALATPLVRGPAGAQQGRRAITTVELGSLPLEYYLPGLHALGSGSTVAVDEIDETGYAPLRASAGRSPAPGFRPAGRIDVNGLIAYRFVSARPRTISRATLAHDVITHARPEVLVFAR
jgi:mannosyltransferase